MDDENDKLEEDFYQFLNLPRDVSISFSVINNVRWCLCRLLPKENNQNMCYINVLLHMTYFCLSDVWNLFLYH